ncbi:sec-independent protein translocase protein TatA [Caulobacter ginsengisoli]|uniref:Sec-independent protein translocase protein TatA n=1 Tax=Caulobacter ginsengisoli TaxID=400775 RepID=A0ABU0IP76_9CAUL|nr:twin-arginine translocase TatA/TatE family subunit [Caulobacter ginsengisoli]MDQ0463808.1 sec-independent protein translocase protein TatA [Caulobacter ginsengisoli]
MGGLQPIHWIFVALVALLLFGGRGKLSGIMGDAAKGIKAFREGLKNEEKPEDVVATPLPRTEPAKDEARN